MQSDRLIVTVKTIADGKVTLALPDNTEFILPITCLPTGTTTNERLECTFHKEGKTSTLDHKRIINELLQGTPHKS